MPGLKEVFMMSQCFILNFAIYLPNTSKTKLFLNHFQRKKRFRIYPPLLIFTDIFKWEKSLVRFPLSLWKKNWTIISFVWCLLGYILIFLNYLYFYEQMNHFTICSTSHGTSDNFPNNGIYAVGCSSYKLTTFSV
jgi:hypothetical protein